ncbi:MAG: Hpt domain-containing protein [Solirubrobacterales bacterium]
MLAAEAGRRTPAIIDGLEALAGSGEKDPGRIEELRVEAHGLKGAALVVGQDRLAELAKQIEQFLSASVDTGQIQPGAAAALIAGASAFNEGAQAAAEGIPEPSSVADSLAALPE